MASSTAPTGCSGQHHAGQRRRQARERHADQQPAQHLRREGQREQVAVRGPARDEIELAQRQADQQRDDRGRQGGVEQRPGRPAQVGIAVAQDQQEGGVREAGGQPDHHAQLRVLAVGAGADDAGDEHHAGQHQGDGERGPQREAFAQQQPGEHRHEDDLRVAEHGGQARADQPDGVVDTAPGRWRRRCPPARPSAPAMAPAGHRRGVPPAPAPAGTAARRRNGTRRQWQAGRSPSLTRIPLKAIVAAPSTAANTGRSAKASKGRRGGRAGRGRRTVPGSPPETSGRAAGRRAQTCLPDRGADHDTARVAELPVGTVTFLFTDIQGSTATAQRLGDALAGGAGAAQPAPRRGGDGKWRHRVRNGG